ncbi:MAG: class I SAM-dependent methyltransferase [Thermoanaerobaculia bacterium]
MKRDWKAEAIKQWDNDPCGADAQAPFGSPKFFERVEEERYERYAPWMKSAIGFDRYRGKRVLEVGFGLGTDHVSFSRGGARCFGIDLTPAHITATRRRLELEHSTPRLSQGDAEKLPFADQSFDVVYSFGVLHHTPGTQAAVDEIHRVLRPGGEAIVGLYHRDSLFFWAYCVGIRGVLLGGFFREGYCKTLSRIERRENSDAVPLVKVYSRRSVRRLFRRFNAVGLSVHHFDFDHAGRLGRFARRFFARHEARIAGWFGWYVIARGIRSVS